MGKVKNKLIMDNLKPVKIKWSTNIIADIEEDSKQMQFVKEHLNRSRFTTFTGPFLDPGKVLAILCL